MTRPSPARIFALCLLIPLLGLTTGCAAGKHAAGSDPVSNDEFAQSDPLEKFNRVIFSINNALDHLVIRPLAVVYKNVVPAPVRKGVTNALSNAWQPITFLNSLLQGDVHNAGRSVGSFAVNSTVGVAGLFDPASGMGLRARTEDFGQTLGKWGFEPGFYLVLPIFGPSDLRDGIGRGVDTLSNPITWIGGEYEWVKYAVAGGYVLDYRTNNLNTIDNIYATSVDPYASIRSLYLQRRKAEIANH